MSNALHEAGHAVVAWWAGDRRPEIRNRMTLNPLNHVHWLLTIVLPIVTYLLLQWPVRRREARDGRRGQDRPAADGARRAGRARSETRFSP